MPRAVTAKDLVLEGNPHEVIARVAQERDCSLIICGKHGQHWVQSMVIGSTALRLCEKAGRPVLRAAVEYARQVKNRPWILLNARFDLPQAERERACPSNPIALTW
jgi:hypothetical protein